MYKEENLLNKFLGYLHKYVPCFSYNENENKKRESEKLKNLQFSLWLSFV